MQNESEKAYPDLETLVEEELDANSSYSKILALSGDGCRVLDVGCASGYMARLLSTRGCRVTGLDISSKALETAQKYCERVVAADLDTVSLHELFPEGAFDVVIFADVLEHLRNPWQTLDDARRVLGYSGHAIVSIPNIAHGAIRLGLLKGHFDYTEFGILDNTHLRFFTRRTIDELLVRSGFQVEQTEKTLLPLFAPSNLVPQLEPTDFDEATIAKIRTDPDYETLQFVIKARALGDSKKLALITEKYLTANAQLEAKTESEVSKEAYDRLVVAGYTLEKDLQAAKLENARLNEALEANREAMDQIRAERAALQPMLKREAQFQLQLADIANSIEGATRGLERRIEASNNQLRHQRAAFDEICGQLAVAREMAERAKPLLAVDLRLGKTSEAVSAPQLLAVLRWVRGGLSGLVRLVRRAFARFTSRLHAPKPGSSR